MYFSRQQEERLNNLRKKLQSDKSEMKYSWRNNKPKFDVSNVSKLFNSKARTFYSKVPNSRGSE